MIEATDKSICLAIMTNVMVKAIIAFSLNTGAYTSEILRSAFQTIKPGIIEAGQSLGISKKIIFYKIISWYDNEAGYSARLANLVERLA